MHSTERLAPEHRQTLLRLARDSITHGLRHGRPLDVEPDRHPAELQAERASFVTLNRRDRLRGCIGHLSAVQALVVDVVDNAFAAAFRDPRFSPVRTEELAEILIHISVLTPEQPMNFRSEDELLQQIRPGIDGLILRDGTYQGTFLPSVWESLPDPGHFWRHLKGKAGLPADHWTSTLTVSRYQTLSFGEG
jgi:AmmeMemoRadiSam system protein A